MAFQDIPIELQQLNQWVNWRYETIQETDKNGNVTSRVTKIPIQSRNGRKASVTDPRDWSTFKEAVESAIANNVGIGFVFTASDPFTGIDLDAPEGNAELCRQHDAIYSTFASYSEKSPSGFGLHIIVKAKLPGPGRRRNKVEIYDNGRFFTFTGNLVNSLPIAERQDEAFKLWQSLGGTQTVEALAVGSNTEAYTDAEVVEHAGNAANGDKFKRLWQGDWQTDYAPPKFSQSEADFALINILAFYSRNVPQVTRLFRASGLGQRAKAQRGSYVNLMVRRAFDRMPKQVALNGTAGPWFDATQIAPWDKPVSLAHAGPYVSPVATEPTVDLPATPGALPPIPGLVGRLMAHCWHASTYPIEEVALASALTTMSVLTSRTHRFGSRGLSLYVLLIAKTSVGKSFAYQAQHALLNAIRKRFSDPTGGLQYKARLKFLENMITGKIASGAGLANHMVKSPSTLAQLDEFASTMKRLAHPMATTNDIGIKEEILSLVDASRPGAVYREKRYSDRGSTKEAITVQSACLTILATGTPQDFYNDLSNDILESGFIPRFTLLDYDGTLPQKNHSEIHDIDRELINEVTGHFNRLFELSQVITGDLNQLINVEIDPEAKASLDQFERFCENEVRKSHRMNTPTSGIWSRAQMHVAQIAALIAIGVNQYKPVITLELFRLALLIVQPGLQKLTGKVLTGEIGLSDTRGAAEIRAFVRRLKAEGPGFFAQYAPLYKPEIFEAGYIQLSTIKWYCCKRAPFNNHRLGSVKSFDDCLASMMRDGEFEKREFVAANGRKVPAIIYLGDF